MKKSKWYKDKIFFIAKRILFAKKQKGMRFLIQSIITATIAFPIALIILVIYPFYKIRFIQLYSSRIGHFIMNTHLLLSALEMKEFSEETSCAHFYYLQHTAPLSNHFFKKMIKRKIIILPFSQLWSFVDRILISILKDKYQTPFKILFEQSMGGYDKLNLLERCKKNYFSFSEKEKKLGKSILKKIGIPENKPYVCLMVRDSAYLKKQFPNTNDWEFHAYRNSTLENYAEVINYLTDREIYVIRMGKFSEEKISINNSYYIDYANHPVRSDFLDIYLPSQCLFFISNSSGIDVLAPLFKRPLITTNAILYDFHSCFPWVLTIPKNVMNTDTKSYLPFSTVYDDYMSAEKKAKIEGGHARTILLSMWMEKKCKLVENTADELLAIVKEMLEILAKNKIECDISKSLQSRFWRDFPIPLSPHEKSHEEIKFKISPFFLKKHKGLISNNETVYEN